MIDANANKSRYIRVTGCHDCPPSTRRECDVAHNDINGVSDCMDTKTIHPDCPLDSDFQKEVLITAELGMEIRRNESERVLAPVRAVWEEMKVEKSITVEYITEGYNQIVIERSIKMYGKCVDAIKESLKLVEGEK